MIPYGSITTFIALYSVDASIGSGGVFFVLLAVSNGLSRLFSGRICDKKGEDIIVYIAIPSVVTALILLAFFMSAATFYIAAVLYGIGFGSMAPSMQAMAVRIASPERRGSASSTYLSAFDMGIGSGGMISGVLVKYFGYGQMYAIMSLWLVISFGCYFFGREKALLHFIMAKTMLVKERLSAIKGRTKTNVAGQKNNLKQASKRKESGRHGGIYHKQKYRKIMNALLNK